MQKIGKLSSINFLQPWTDTSREDSKGSEPDSWDISEAPIARLESLDEIDRAQV
jgi:hypothetical protein